MRVTDNVAFSMKEISEWYLVMGEDSDYNNPITFKEEWEQEDKNKHKK